MVRRPRRGLRVRLCVSRRKMVSLKCEKTRNVCVSQKEIRACCLIDPPLCGRAGISISYTTSFSQGNFRVNVKQSAVQYMVQYAPGARVGHFSTGLVAWGVVRIACATCTKNSSCAGVPSCVLSCRVCRLSWVENWRTKNSTLCRVFGFGLLGCVRECAVRVCWGGPGGSEEFSKI